MLERHISFSETKLISIFWNFWEHLINLLFYQVYFLFHEIDQFDFWKAYEKW